MTPAATTRRIYLDHNATAPLLDEARDAMNDAMRLAPGRGNPSSPHAFGHEARLSLERSRREVASLIGADPREIVFVSGGTEADNLAIQGVARAWIASHGRLGRPGRVVTSAIEHPAVLETCRHLASTGWDLTIVGVDAGGVVRVEELRAALAQGAALVSIMAANNETGVIQPIAAVASIALAAGVPLHVDAVQAAGKIPLDVRTLGADFVSLSSHKIGGPVGIGALWVREGAAIHPLMHGGGQERRRRPGTESPVLAAGFAAAASRASRALAAPAAAADPIDALRGRLEAEVKRRLPRARVNASNALRLFNTSSLTIPGLDNETLVIRLDLEGFAVSTGSACSTGSARPSHVLGAMGMTSDDIGSTLRISLGPSNTQEEIDALADALERAALEAGEARVPAPAEVVQAKEARR